MQTTRHTHETGGKEVYAGMTANFSSFRKKELINVSDGMKLGFVDDIMFDSESAEVRSLVVYGKAEAVRPFGQRKRYYHPVERYSNDRRGYDSGKKRGNPCSTRKEKSRFF